MGMDIYFQAFDVTDAPLGKRQELRCREVYHAVNDWCEETAKPKRETPENGEHVSFNAAQWAQVAPSISRAISRQDQDLSGASQAEADALGAEWLELIWPDGAHRVEYWYTV